MGLISELDDHIGRLMAFLDQRGQLANTVVVLTSDHGDYLGDHWLGEKDLFHEPSVRIPMIVYNPNRTADATRGTTSSALVEAIDLVPTFIEYAGGKINHERLEGRSLMPLLRTQQPPPEQWRKYAISEIDYSDRGPRQLLDLPPYECRAIMLREARWKYVHYNLFRPQLFDLQEDPQELNDLGRDEDHGRIRSAMRKLLLDWRRRLKPRVGMPYDNLEGMGPERDEALGIVIGRW